jgi:hypothetical protein
MVHAASLVIGETQRNNPEEWDIDEYSTTHANFQTSDRLEAGEGEEYEMHLMVTSG